MAQDGIAQCTVICRPFSSTGYTECLRRCLTIHSTLARSLTSSAFPTPTSRQNMDEDYYTQQLHCGHSEASFKMRSPTHQLQTLLCRPMDYMLHRPGKLDLLFRISARFL